MRKSLKNAAVFGMAFVFLSALSFAQVKLEITGFGNYNFNLGYPKDLTMDSVMTAFIPSVLDELKPFFNSAVLGQKGGLGFGGRIALQFSPLIAVEGSVEYIMAETMFNADNITALKTGLQSIGYTSYTTIQETGGNILRFYGNLVINIPAKGNFVPYVTAGIGLTQFKVQPSIIIDRPDRGEHFDLTYNNASALTFNGGAGFKYFFSDMVGIRFDARIFFGSPEFQQVFGYEWHNVTSVPTGNHITQKGSHTDATLNLGIVIRLM